MEQNLFIKFSKVGLTPSVRVQAVNSKLACLKKIYSIKFLRNGTEFIY